MTLLAVCGVAFTAVFLILCFLAVAMELIARGFPEAAGVVDAAVVAAIASAVATSLPGASVTRIEEEE